jgi:Tat protein secretion system quality control protein TatD with DNase activity
VKEIAETIAPVKQCTLAELSAATSRTARDFFARLT